MEKEDLLEWMKKVAERVNYVAQRLPAGMGFSIPIPEGVNEESKRFVEDALRSLSWRFERTFMGQKEYFILFPTGQ